MLPLYRWVFSKSVISSLIIPWILNFILVRKWIFNMFYNSLFTVTQSSDFLTVQLDTIFLSLSPILEKVSFLSHHHLLVISLIAVICIQSLAYILQISGLSVFANATKSSFSVVQGFSRALTFLPIPASYKTALFFLSTTGLYLITFLVLAFLFAVVIPPEYLDLLSDLFGLYFLPFRMLLEATMIYSFLYDLGFRAKVYLSQTEEESLSFETWRYFAIFITMTLVGIILSNLYSIFNLLDDNKIQGATFGILFALVGVVLLVTMIDSEPTFGFGIILSFALIGLFCLGLSSEFDLIPTLRLTIFSLDIQLHWLIDYAIVVLALLFASYQGDSRDSQLSNLSIFFLATIHIHFILFAMNPQSGSEKSSLIFSLLTWRILQCCFIVFRMFDSFQRMQSFYSDDEEEISVFSSYPVVGPISDSLLQLFFIKPTSQFRIEKL